MGGVGIKQIGRDMTEQQAVAELQATIEALLDARVASDARMREQEPEDWKADQEWYAQRFGMYEPLSIPVDRVRALVADGGAAALREVKHAVWVEAYAQGVADERKSQDMTGGSVPPGRLSPYRDTAGDLCDRCGHEHDPADPSQCIIPASRLNAGEAGDGE